jgi:large subunit ribosomal protein L17
MRHRANSSKLGRKSQHRDAMLANLVVSLIEHTRIKTTVAKAKAARVLADQVVTLGKRADLHSQRLAVAKLGNKGAVTRLFKVIAPTFGERAGGYTRVIKLGPRNSDAAPMAFLEWTQLPAGDEPAKVEAAAEPAPKAVESEAKPAAKPKAKRATKPKADKAPKAE